MTKCPKCNSELKKEMKFCYKCGSKMPVMKEKCPNCGIKLKNDAKFCHQCGTEVDIEMSEIATRNLPASARSKRAISEHAQEHTLGFSPAVLDKKSYKKGKTQPEKETEEMKGKGELPEDASIWKKFSHGFSKLLEEEDNEEEKIENDEEETNIGFNSTKNKYVIIGAVIFILLVLGLTWHALFKADDRLYSEDLPSVDYNPKTNEAKVIIGDEKYIRKDVVYGYYIDLIFAIPSSSDKLEEDIFDREKLSQTFIQVPYKVDVFLKDELPNNINEMYPIFVRTPIPVNRTSNEEWGSHAFKLDQSAIETEDAVFLVMWDTEEFPFGNINTISLKPSRTN